MLNVMRRFLMAAAFGFLAPAAIQAGIILEYTSETNGSAISNLSAGWSFTTNQAITVTALDASTAGGLSSYNVRLYNAAQVLQASTTVLNTDPVEGTAPARFYSHAITPVTLLADTTYFISMDFPTGTAAQFEVGGLTTDPSITYGAAVLTNSGLGQDPITDMDNGQDNPGDFGPNFDIGTAVPEPSSIILLGLFVGVIGCGAWMRRRRGAVALPA